MMLQVVTGVLPAGTYTLTLEVRATGAYAIKYAPGAMSALIVPEI